VLFASTQELFPAGASLPAAGAGLANPAVRSFWSEVTVGGERYEALFLRGTQEEGQVIILSLPVQGTSSYLFNLVKVLVYYILVVLVVLVGYLAVRWIRRLPLRITFRDRLLVALLLTAVAPLIVIAYYGKDFAEQRLMEETQRRLQRETESVSFRILQEGDEDRGLTAALAEQIAVETGTDFNYYTGMRLQSTSKPELYAAGLLDRRLSGSAYAAVVIDRERFYQQTENIGRYRYAVGYRPVHDSRSALAGVVSVPTLYRQDELDRQVSQQNAFLFGVYAVVFLAVVVLATTVASRIASPIHRLTDATRRVSLGEFDVPVGGGKAVGEIGELVRSFETMTRNLRRQRDELVRYERELAWKEMAKQVAHEIKNPLTPMKLSLQHLRQTYHDKAPDFGRILEDVVATVIKQIDALSRIASEFSHFAQMPKANLEQCDLNEIACEASRLFEGEKLTTIEKELHPDPLPIVADKEMLRRAFINIIRNGIQAMNNQGLMIVSTRRRGTRAEISFKDHGAGIPDEIRGKLFQPNFSTKTDGMGLGLAIVKKTIDDLKGNIRVESSQGKGTEVVIDLPVSSARSEKPEQ
jgi:signal transduction histidine kinase